LAPSPRGSSGPAVCAMPSPMRATAQNRCRCATWLLALSGASAAVSETDKTEVLFQHNLLRCMHGAGQLTWDDTLASEAQAWADTSVTTGHKPGEADPSVDLSVTGENELLIAKGTGILAVSSWYSAFLSKGVNLCKNLVLVGDQIPTDCLHYTQIVWAATTKIGCGKSRCNADSCATNDKDDDFWICRYKAPGNFPAQLSANVHERTRTPAQCMASAGSTPQAPPKKITWAFGTEPSSCGEVGYIELQVPSSSANNAAATSESREYDVVGFGVDQSTAGLPVGSTKTGAYMLPASSEAKPLRMQVNVIDGQVEFSGLGSVGKHVVIGLTGVYSEMTIDLGSGHGTIKQTSSPIAGDLCKGNIYFVTDKPVILRKFEISAQAAELLKVHSGAFAFAACGLGALAAVLVAGIFAKRRASSPELTRAIVLVEVTEVQGEALVE